MYDDFFEAMADVWQVADKFNLSVPFTNFVMFGPQSSGKTTITERILGFPVAVVKSGIGTTRPMVLTTRRAESERVEVKARENESFRSIKKEDVMKWVKEQMEFTGRDGKFGNCKISTDRIFIEVSGKNYKNRRFVDLPGFQSVGEEGKNTREAILALLKDEMAKPNTVVVCVEDSTQEYFNSNLVLAMREVFGSEFAGDQELRERFVFAFNKTDLWLSSGEVTESSFLEHYEPYVTNTGLVPVLVGASIDASDFDLRVARSAGSATFQAIVNEYRGANEREAKVYDAFLRKVTWEENFTECLKDKFFGFDKLLRTIDASVVRRDIENLPKISQQLHHLIDETSQNMQALKQQLLLRADSDKILESAQVLIKRWIKYANEIATADHGDALERFVSPDYVDIHGNTAIMEEMEFVFGDRNDCMAISHRDIKFKEWCGYYNTKLQYRPDDILVPQVDDGIQKRWCEEIVATVNELIRSKNDPSSSKPVSYLETRLISGQVFERAIGVWASSVYRLAFPTEKDRSTLANLIGINPDAKDPNCWDYVKVRRLVGMYANRLTPAVHFLCQKMEFLLLKNFDTAWAALIRFPDTKAFVKMVGEKKLHDEIHGRYREIVRKKAEIAFGKCISDLRNEANKFFPYTRGSAPSGGMMLAYPNAVLEIEHAMTKYDSKWKDFITSLKTELFPEGLVSGIEFGLDIIAAFGSIDPLLFSGLLVVQKLILPATKKMLKKPSLGGKGNLEDRDEHLLGVARAIYANFLPRFIATVEARMRSDLWGSDTDTLVESELETYLKQSPVLMLAKDQAKAEEEELIRLKEQKEELRKAHIKCVKTEATYPETAQPVRVRQYKEDGTDEKENDLETEGDNQTLNQDDVLSVAFD
jgi:GTPase SAR1 family protein